MIFILLSLFLLSTSLASATEITNDNETSIHVHNSPTEVQADENTHTHIVNNQSNNAAQTNPLLDETHHTIKANIITTIEPSPGEKITPTISEKLTITPTPKVTTISESSISKQSNTALDTKNTQLTPVASFFTAMVNGVVNFFKNL